VPRPPRSDAKIRGRRGRRARREERAAQTGPRVPSEAELAGMSAAGRRLYGFDDDRAEARGHQKN
jgi:hypothetical protein